MDDKQRIIDLTEQVEILTKKVEQLETLTERVEQLESDSLQTSKDLYDLEDRVYENEREINKM